jgi:pyruvate,water dikinase
MTIIDRINTLLRRKQRTSPATLPLRAEELQRLFTANYRCFHDLLRANNNALEAMAELEQALRDGRTLSMAFIRAKSTAVAINVYKIVHNLNKLSDGRHSELERIFSRLQQSIDTLLDGEKPSSSPELIVPLEQISRKQVDLVGEKMANLGEIAALAGMQSPSGFAITSTASRLFFYRNNLYPAINHILQRLDIANLEDLHAKSAAIQEKISSCPLPPELETLLFEHYDALVAATAADIKVAVRSSALGEDLGQASFAGLYHTELHVDREQLVSAYKSVLASKFSPRAISYRLAKGYRHEETEMCVGCLAMIEATTSGICYSRSISGGINTLDIFSAGGSAKGIVDGTRTTNHWLIDRSPPHRILHREFADQTGEAMLTDPQTGALTAIALTLENHFGSPQDIEWSITPAGTIYVLQSRPISVSHLSSTPGANTIYEDERLLIRGGATGCAGVGSGPV